MTWPIRFNTNRSIRICALGLLVLARSVAGGETKMEHDANMKIPPLNTFSIVAFDPESGDLGIAVASRVLGVGSIVPWAKADVGAIATQSQANTAYGPDGLALLQSGNDAAETLHLLTQADAGRDDRQVGIVDAKGNAAGFTGPKCIEWTGDLQGDHYTVQGNLLAGEAVLKQMATEFEQARQQKDSELADWLMAALAAGEGAGGDKRGKQSASLLVVRKGAGYLGNDRYIDLRVEDHAEPVTELARLLKLHKEVFEWPHTHKPQRESEPAADRKSSATAEASPKSKSYPVPTPGDFIVHDFHFSSGASLPELRMHYLTLGRPQRDATGVVRNAVLILHGTTGSSDQFLRPEFATELFGPDQPLDTSRFFIIIPDNVGHGKSSKPSDGLRAKFPQYGYRDMIEAQHRLLTEGLGVNHARLILGTSMGGMHCWLWGQMHPEFMDALVPLASLPGQISGRNRVWRRIVIDAIRNDLTWHNGDYTSQPTGLRTAIETLYFMSSNPVLRLQEGPTLRKADDALDRYVTEALKIDDANDVLYAVEASRDYDPAPGLEQIKAPLLAINFADDLINPPELGVLEREIGRVPHGRAIVIPRGDKSVGHGTHTAAAVWKDHLVDLLKQTEPPQ